ncbi:MAG: amidinotransferase [Rhodothermales bacterium]|nr:amidinotransferase [Rhodothermales bacterium]
MVYKSARNLDFSIGDVPVQPLPDRVLFASPDYFNVKYVINPHMEGHIGEVDVDEAQREWNRLRTAYDGLGLDTHVVPARPGLPDLVFCANQTLPYLSKNDDSKGVVLSRMFAVQRRDEVPFLAEFFSNLGYDVLDDLIDENTSFEGMGDALWHPGRRLLWGGYGYRTSAGAYDVISDRLDVDVLLLQLEDPDFYHLDTCFCPLNESSVLIWPGAFTDEGVALIEAVFEHVLEAPEDESRSLFACNAHCPDGRNVVIQRGCSKTTAMLRSAGFVPVEVDTGEFLKSGGSVFCMKQMFW